MADGVEFSIIGLEDLRAKLQEISKDMQFKGGRFALRKAAQLIRDAAKQNALAVDDPQSEDKISDNIAERWNGRLNKQTGDLGFRIGVLGGAVTSDKYASVGSLPGKDTRHWRLIEFGTSKVAARPFMRPALSDNIGTATDTFVREYSRAVERAIRRAKKTGK